MEIKISKCASKCYGCDTPFAHEQRVHSSAKIVEEQLERRDYCATCRPADGEAEVFCAWNVQYVDPQILEAERQESFSPLRRLFYDMAASGERAALAQAYLAAQLLKRQRVFRQVRESEDAEGAGRITLFLDRAGNRLIETRDLNFSYTELDEARVLLLDALRALESPLTEEAIEVDNAADLPTPSKDDADPRQEQGLEVDDLPDKEALLEEKDDGTLTNQVNTHGQSESSRE